VRAKIFFILNEDNLVNIKESYDGDLEITAK
jgi:hypothetical protein